MALKNYLVVLWGYTEPSLGSPSDDESAPLQEYCKMVSKGECREAFDPGFVLQIDENGSPSVCPFGSTEVEEMLDQMKADSLSSKNPS